MYSVVWHDWLYFKMCSVRYLNVYDDFTKYCEAMVQ